jgi:hypothetical protein
MISDKSHGDAGSQHLGVGKIRKATVLLMIPLHMHVINKRLLKHDLVFT